MLADIKKLCGINNTDFDSIINMQIESAKADLKACGIAPGKINDSDPLIYSAISTYVKGFIDVENSELYKNAYDLQKDALRHYKEYRATAQE